MSVTYICISCGSRHTGGDDELTGAYHISLNSSLEETFISASKIVPLATNDETTINEFTKFIASNGDMFIFDKRMQSIHIFDSIGDSKKYFNRHGAGPGEYVDANDFTIDGNNNIYVADIGTQRIIRYEYPDYELYEVFPIRRAFTNFDISDDLFYIANLSENNDLKIKLATRQPGDKSIKVLSVANVDNEYRAVGAGRTHLWKSDSTLLFYDRFTPYIYKLSNGGAEKFITINREDIPDERLIHELINLPAPQRYAKLSEPTNKIIDISSCFETDKYILMEIRTMPLKYIVIDKKSGDYKMLSTLLAEGFHSSIGLIGVYGEYFVTATSGNENDNPQLVFFDIKN